MRGKPREERGTPQYEGGNELVFASIRVITSCPKMTDYGRVDTFQVQILRFARKLWFRKDAVLGCYCILNTIKTCSRNSRVWFQKYILLKFFK